MESLRNGSSQMVTEWNAVVGLCEGVFFQGLPLLSSILLAFSGRGEGGWECEGPFSVKSTVLLQVLWVQGSFSKIFLIQEILLTDDGARTFIS